VTFSIGQRAVVADASVAIRMLVGTEEWLARWAEWLREDALILVPAHFGHEVANGLLRSARIGEAPTVGALAKLAELGIEVADRGFTRIATSVHLADRHGLTVYDASYLELALEVDAELATLDRQLAAAAEAEGVPLVPAGAG
jgi:predicted nucleic acid-binding protein